MEKIMKIFQVLKKYWWVFPALVAIPIIYIVGRYLKTVKKSKIMFEEYLRP